MRTKRNIIGIVALMALVSLFSSSVFAQQTVVIGSTTSYEVTNDNSGSGWTYNWAVSGGGTVATPAATTTDINWTTAGNYVLTLTETNTSCPTLNTVNITVLGAPTLAFTAATSASCADAAEVVALSFSGVGAAYYPLVVNYELDGAAQAAITFNDGDPLQITIPVGSRGDLVPVGNYTVTLEITGATSNGGTVTLNAPTTHTNTVNDIPEANPIVVL